jgi:hypothetical protein
VLEVKGPARPEQMSDTGSPRSRVVPLMVLDRVRDVCSRRNWLASEECRELAALITFALPGTLVSHHRR